MKVVRQGIGLSREALDVPSLELFKTRLHVVLRNLVHWNMFLSMAEDLKIDDLKGPIKHRAFSDSMI